MALADRFRELESALPDGWADARFQLTIPDDAERDRAAALLGPTNPGRRGNVIQFATARRGAGVGPDRVRGLLRRLDADGIDGRLELVGVDEAPRTPGRERPSFARRWDELVGALPPDWSDLFAEVELASTDYVEPGALALSPVNPGRYGSRSSFRFRVARIRGYGASPEMTRRCLERLDEAGITGEIRILRALSDTFPARTQGPVWYAGGRVF